MPDPAYREMWQPRPSAAHALIGALFGAGIGVALGMKGNASAGATLGIATVGAGLGAAIGLTVPPMPSRNPYWRRWPDDGDDEEAHHSKPHKSKIVVAKTNSPSTASPAPSPSRAEGRSAAAGQP